MSERKNFKSTSATGKLIHNELNTYKEICETFASRKSESNEQLSRWFDRVYLSYDYDLNTSKRLESESAIDFDLRKKESAKANLARLTESLKVNSDLNKLLVSKNKLFTLALDFAPAIFVDNVHKFAKVYTIAYDKDNLTSEQVASYESKCVASESKRATFAKVEHFVNDERKTFFVKVEYLSSVESFFAGDVNKLLSRRKSFDELSEQDEIFFEKESASKLGRNIQVIKSNDKLNESELCKFVAFALYPQNKKKIELLANQRKQAQKERKQAKKESASK